MTKTRLAGIFAALLLAATARADEVDDLRALFLAPAKGTSRN